MGLISALVMDDIETAAQAAVVKHGPLTTDPLRACAIMVREAAGEALDEALLMTKPQPNPGYDSFTRRKTRSKLYIELAQVAATAAVIMDNLRREGI